MLAGQFLNFVVDESAQVGPKVFHDDENAVGFATCYDIVQFWDVLRATWLLIQLLHDLYLPQHSQAVIVILREIFDFLYRHIAFIPVTVALCDHSKRSLPQNLAHNISIVLQQRFPVR